VGSIYLCLAIFCAAIALPGCGEEPKANLAEENLTAEDFAAYEANLADAQNAADYTVEDEGEEAAAPAPAAE